MLSLKVYLKTLLTHFQSLPKYKFDNMAISKIVISKKVALRT